MARFLVLALVLSASLLVASCADSVTGRLLGPADLDAAITAIGDISVEVGDGLDGDLLAYAMDLPCGWFSFVDEPFAIPSVAYRPLERGKYECDMGTFMWVYVEPSAFLEYHWVFDDADDVERNAALVIDWGTTQDVSDGDGGTMEMPTDDMSMTLTVDGAVGGALDVEVEWYSGPACPGGVLVPTRGQVDGSIGFNAKVTMDEVGFTLDDEAFATSGAIVATAGTASIGIDWDIGLDIDLTRDACFIVDAVLQGGRVEVGVHGSSAGTTTRLDMGFAFSDIDIDEGLSVAISSGTLRLNGAMLVSFSGTLDFVNYDNTPAEGIALVFADGTTMTLEAYLEAYVMDAGALARRAFSLLR